MVGLFALLAGAAPAGMGLTSTGKPDGLPATGRLIDLIIAGLLLGALLLFRADDRYLRYVVESLTLILLAKFSIFFLVNAAG